MIRLLTLQEFPLLASLCAPTWTDCRLKAVAKAYGAGYDFIRFYANGDATILIGYEDGFTSVLLRGDDPSLAAEAAEFVSMLSREILSNRPLPLPGYYFEQGGVYSRPLFPPEPVNGVTEELSAAYPLLSQVFPDTVNKKNYEKWYADLSHRVRHGMSRVFTLPGAASATIYCVENGCLNVAQLGVLPEVRGQGWGRRMLAQLCAACPAADRLLLLSQDAKSDRFYEHLGFDRPEDWYYYTKDE